MRPWVAAALGVAALLQGCGDPVIRAADVPDWPLTVSEAQIVCAEGRPVRAVINGKPYALNGTEMAKYGIPALNHDQVDLFKPNPDPFLAARGFKAYGDGFNAAAEKACRGA